MDTFMNFNEIVLAIDYGTKRVGLATAHTSLAEPLDIIPNDQTLVARLLQLIEEESITRIVIGLSENQMAEETKVFGQHLAQATAVPIEYWDETLSSNTVHQKMLEGSAKKSRRQQPIDHLAAAEFLQEWLDVHA
jgi:putative transcription antitermination factor YqgF